jgi:hypothetical protein
VDTQTVATSSGLFNAILGKGAPVPDSVFKDTVRYLGIGVFPDGEMSPRQRLGSVGYAYESAQWTSAGQNLFRLDGNVGIGTTTTQNRLHVNGGISWGGNTTAPYARSDLDASGLFVEHVGTNSADENIRIQSSKNGDLANYSQFIIDPSNGFSFTTVGAANGNVAIGTTPSFLVNRLTVQDIGSNGANAVLGFATGSNGNGVLGRADNGGNAYGIWGYSSSGFAGYFSGTVHVAGTLSKTAGSFKIDHPTDPVNKYLYHSFVESPDMMNIYNGNVTLDSKGEAVIALPNWFGALNKDFRYQLTCIGGFAQVYVAEKVKNNRFKIAGGTAGLEVSWQVTGIRQDAYANAHRIPVEELKSDKERGYYLHPDLFGQPEEKGTEWARHPEMMKEMKEQREKAKAESEK